MNRLPFPAAEFINRIRGVFRRAHAHCKPNSAGSKLVRRAAKHHFGSRKTFAEALNWYTNLRGLRL